MGLMNSLKLAGEETAINDGNILCGRIHYNTLENKVRHFPSF